MNPSASVCPPHNARCGSHISFRAASRHCTPPGTHALSSPVDATAVTGAQSVKAVSADSAEATAEPWERAAGMSLPAAADVAAAKCVSRIWADGEGRG